MVHLMPPGVAELHEHMRARFANMHSSMQELMQQLTGHDFGMRMRTPEVHVIMATQPRPPPTMAAGMDSGFRSKVFLGPRIVIESDVVTPQKAPMTPAFKPAPVFTPAWARFGPVAPMPDVITIKAPAETKAPRYPHDLKSAAAWLRGENMTKPQLYARNMLLIKLAALSTGIMFLLALTVGIMKCRYSDARESARERPLRALAEPLVTGDAPEIVQKTFANVNTAGTTSMTAAAGVSTYLSRVYKRFFEPAPVAHEGVSMYLARVYLRYSA
jgi:hypothetical protein